MELNKNNIKIHLASLGDVELKYVSINDSIEYYKLLQKQLSDKDFVEQILFHQLVKPEMEFAKFQLAPDSDLEELARAFIEKYISKYFKDSGDIFKDFRQALATKQEKDIDELRKTIEPIIKSTQEALTAFNIGYASIIQQTINGTSYIQESLQGFARFAKQIAGIRDGIFDLIGPAIEQYQTMSKVIVESLTPQINIWQKWVDKNQSIFSNLIKYWAIFAEKFNITEQKAVRILRKYKWFITPSIPMSFIFKIVKHDKYNGRQDKAVNNLFVKYFEAKRWRNLKIMVDGWKNKPLFKKRYKILVDCVETIKIASKNGINGANVVLPTLITQIDGLLTDYLNSKGIQWNSSYNDFVDKKTNKVRSVGRITQFKKTRQKVMTTQLDDLANDIFLNILFQKAHKGKPLSTPFNFNRHKIIHGESVNFGRKDYLIRAFMVLDFIAQF